jgi:hypothetical protein
MSDPPQHSDAITPTAALAAMGFAFSCSVAVRPVDNCLSSLINEASRLYPARQQAAFVSPERSA